MKKFNRLINYLLWTVLPPAISDSSALILSGIIAYHIRTSSLFVVDPYILNPREYLFLLFIGFSLWHVVFAVNGGYAYRSLLFRIDELINLFNTSIAVFSLLMASTFLYKSYDFSRLIVFFSWLLFVTLSSLFRQLSYRIKEELFKRGFGRRRLLLAGFNSYRPLLEQRLQENPALGFDFYSSSRDQKIEEILQNEEFDEVFVFEEQITYEKIWKIRAASKNKNLIIHLIPPFGNLYLRNLKGGFFDGTLMIRFDSPTDKEFTFVTKRCIDLLVSAFFLVALSPLFILISLLVYLTSPGPIIFRQNRVGKDGKIFTIYKFRTMYKDVEKYATTPVERTDPRITPIGRILRSTGLDELPQLWNVFKGDMSLVGPRPEMPFIVEKYTELERERLRVRPGITGLWQIYARGFNMPIHSHVEYDLYYIENLSLSLDFMILLETIPTIILRTGI